VVIDAPSVECLSTSVNNEISEVRPEIKDVNAKLHVEFFVKKRGNGFGVVHKGPVEVGMPDEMHTHEPLPGEQVQLSGAAMHAIATGNTKLLEMLLQAGLSTKLPLDFETQWTALHYSALSNNPEVAKLLLENGASKDVRALGSRPIDYAFEDGNTEVCEVLRKPNEKERDIGGYPEPLLDEVFRRSQFRDEEVRFLSINGKDPDEEQLKYFHRLWPNVRPRSHAEEIDRSSLPMGVAKTSYRDVKTKDYGIVVELSLKRTGDDTYDWSHREATGSSLAGSGSSGKALKKYGYWFKQNLDAWYE